MTDQHDLDRTAQSLRRELTALHVPFDDARAGEMVSRATEVQVRGWARRAAPLGTAAAVLAVGAGVAVFAANGGGDNAAPPGAPRPPAFGAEPSRDTCRGFGVASQGTMPLPPVRVAGSAGAAQRRAPRGELRRMPASGVGAVPAASPESIEAAGSGACARALIVEACATGSPAHATRVPASNRVGRACPAFARRVPPPAHPPRHRPRHPSG